MPTPMGFEYEQLDVYRVAVQALAQGAVLTRRMPSEDRFVRSQLMRALTSVCFNFAEGIGEFSPGERARFLRMSRRSATEAAAVVDALEIMGHMKPDSAREMKELLRRTCAMLTRLIKRRKDEKTIRKRTS